MKCWTNKYHNNQQVVPTLSSSTKGSLFHTGREIRTLIQLRQFKFKIVVQPCSSLSFNDERRANVKELNNKQSCKEVKEKRWEVCVCSESYGQIWETASHLYTNFLFL